MKFYICTIFHKTFIMSLLTIGTVAFDDVETQPHAGEGADQRGIAQRDVSGGRHIAEIIADGEVGDRNQDQRGGKHANIGHVP